MRIAGLLDRVTPLIVAVCDPDAIILFGSHAKGQASRDSDVDLLVVGDFPGSPFLRDRELGQLLHGFPVRMDLHLATPAEMAAELAKPFGFTRSILSGGLLLHARLPPPDEDPLGALADSWYKKLFVDT
ncbi:nucleotidyltransferase domain-containing protein [Paracoccus rhizosphaerae]|uniref:Nucleotidyltransferase domain-containing protein n=1 Tax=Paracoccus rhizosphaerae TaxID=1133347 RepID=A0ABV6CJ33_9RHOB|nr:nucleotidyltransferase domain-containing protein [Paracoccus rhizosphaerae]